MVLMAGNKLLSEWGVKKVFGNRFSVRFILLYTDNAITYYIALLWYDCIAHESYRGIKDYFLCKIRPFWTCMYPSLMFWLNLLW